MRVVPFQEYAELRWSTAGWWSSGCRWSSQLTGQLSRRRSQQKARRLEVEARHKSGLPDAVAAEKRALVLPRSRWGQERQSTAGAACARWQADAVTVAGAEP